MPRIRVLPIAQAMAAVVLVLLSAERPLRAQSRPGSSLVPRFGLAARFMRTLPLRDLPPDQPLAPEEVDQTAEARPVMAFRRQARGATATPDAALQATRQPQAAQPSGLPGPGTSFDGLNSDDNAALLGRRVIPPDTVGDVGPNHYVEMVNLTWRVFDKSGSPLTPARKLSSIWALLGGPCSTVDDGDSIVAYDPLADRWLLSQFCTIANPNDHQLFAISQTPDPTGAYYLYDFMMPNNKLNDYPKLGVWPDAYYMSDNQFDQTQTFFLGAGAFAFDRAKMLAGDPSAGFVYFDLATSPSTADAGGMLPADLDGLAPPPAGRPCYFSYFTADEFGDPADALRVFELHADFANPALSTFTERPESPVAVAAFDPRSPPGRAHVLQPPPANAAAALDSIPDRLMHRLAYRNFGDHESLVLTHSVNVTGSTTLGAFQAGVRYYVLRRSLPGGGFTVAEQATFAPDSDSRWMGSAAMDHLGDVAVGYSVSSATTFPSIRYAGRLAGDPPGGLFQGETTLIAGTGVQTATLSRWGDYSALSVDPADDCTFWYTNEYYTAASQGGSPYGWLTRIGSFSFPGCTPSPRGTIQGTVTNAQTGGPLAGAVVQTSAGHLTATDTAGRYSLTTAPGTFDMSASKATFLPASAPGITVADGGISAADFALTPTPVLMAAGGSAVSAESCSPATGSLDPGETGAVSLAVKNVGSADTANLVATLQPTGGVTSPGAPQAFGVVPAGGTPVSRTFTFTADPALTCGGTLTATLRLQDGASDLGTVRYTFALGTPGNGTVSSTHGTSDLSTPLPDLSTVEVPIVVPDAGPDALSDVNVRVRLNHTFDGNLVIALVHPDGSVVTLANRRGAGGDNFGSGGNDCSGSFAVFDDDAATAIATGAAPFAGVFRPDQPLSALYGKPSAGTWKLRVTDAAAPDTGTLGCAQIEVKRRPYLCCPFAGGAPVVGAVPPAAVTAESCGPGNAAADPDETISVSFPLQNIGRGPTVDLRATLLPGGGVNTPSGPQSYGPLSPVGPAVSRTFSFVPSGACGATVSATLALDDVGGAGSLGTTAFDLRLGVVSATFSNPAPIAIPGSGTGAYTGAPAAPYPSAIAVSGLLGTVSKVTVTVRDLSHTFPADVDLLLAGPGGRKLLLMSDVGGGTDAVHATITFDDGGVPIGPTVVSGTFRPTNVGTVDLFPPPAPPGPYPDPQRLSVFNGLGPNATWSLYAVDDFGGEVGSIAGGWSLNLTTTEAVCCHQPCSLACPAPISRASDPDQCSALVGFPSPGVTGSCGTIACTPPSGSVLPVGASSDTCTGTSTISGLTTATCSFPISVLDEQPPAISDPSATPAVLQPPNNQMVDVTIGYGLLENCAGSCSLSVSSNEGVNGPSDGSSSADWEVVDAHHVRLRAKCSGNGWVYTVTITCTDTSGNTGMRSVTVQVPPDPP